MSAEETRRKRKSVYRHLREIGEYFIYFANDLRLNPRILDVTTLSSSTKNKKASRAFFGVGAEYLLKAAFIKKGFYVHKINNKKPIPFNFNRRSDIEDCFGDRTLSLGDMINHINLLNSTQKDITEIIEGLKILKRWRDTSIHFELRHRERGDEFPKAVKSLTWLQNITND